MRQFWACWLWASLTFYQVLSASATQESTAKALTSSLSQDTYREQLNLRPLPRSSLLASFNFQLSTPRSELDAHHFRLFPRSLAQILEHSNVHELHLRFNLGRWDAEAWGSRPWDGTREGGTGVELWAWLEAETDEETEAQWRRLTNALSGLFCASLNFIDETRTTRPVMSFQPEGIYPNQSAITDNMKLLHGVLPHEVVCTENLTPFLKMLPCKGKSGISSLLDGHKLFDATWQSMAIDVRPVCTKEGCAVELEQSVDMVLDIPRSRRSRSNPIPRPPPRQELNCDESKPYHNQDTCYPIDSVLGQDWSLSELFGRKVAGTCPLAQDNTPSVCMEVPNLRPLSAEGISDETKYEGGEKRCYHLRPDSPFDVTLVPETEAQQQEQKPQQQQGHKANIEPGLVQTITPPLYAERSFTGYGQEQGGVQSIITNPSPIHTIDFVYMETLPWFMRVYLHTLQVKVNGVRDASAIQEVYYRPAIDRVRGSQLEVRLRIPPESTIHLTYHFEKALLRYTEYPPDANRGFDVPAAIITILNDPTLSPNQPRRHSSLRTTTLLLSLPTPDFSMPYNVIIFTSTTIALAFGSLYNILVRRFVSADEAPKPLLRRGIDRLREKVLRIIR